MLLWPIPILMILMIWNFISSDDIKISDDIDVAIVFFFNKCLVSLKINGSFCVARVHLEFSKSSELGCRQKGAARLPPNWLLDWWLLTVYIYIHIYIYIYIYVCTYIYIYMYMISSSFGMVLHSLVPILCHCPCYFGATTWVARQEHRRKAAQEVERLKARYWKRRRDYWGGWKKGDLYVSDHT